MEWISVKDRLPEDMEYILFTDGKDVYKGHISKACFESFNQENSWISVSGFSISEVSYWMPLPKPPES